MAWSFSKGRAAQRFFVGGHHRGLQSAMEELKIDRLPDGCTVYKLQDDARTCQTGISIVNSCFRRRPFVAIADYDDTFVHASGDDETQRAVFHPYPCSAIEAVVSHPNCKRFAVITARPSNPGDADPIFKALSWMKMPQRIMAESTVRMMPDSRAKGESEEEFVLRMKNSHMRSVVGETAAKLRRNPEEVDVWRVGDTLWDVCDEQAYRAIRSAKLEDGGYIIRSAPRQGERGWSVGVYLNSEATRDIVHDFCDDGGREREEGSGVFDAPAKLGGGGG